MKVKENDRRNVTENVQEEKVYKKMEKTNKKHKNSERKV